MFDSKKKSVNKIDLNLQCSKKSAKKEFNFWPKESRTEKKPVIKKQPREIL